MKDYKFKCIKIKNLKEEDIVSMPDNSLILSTITNIIDNRDKNNIETNTYINVLVPVKEKI